MHVIDLEGNEYALQATSTNEGENSGNQSFSAMIYATKVNKLFINDITEMWNVVDHDDVEHKIIYCKKQGVGNSLKVDIKAIPLFFDTLDNLRVEYDLNEHMTAQVAFTRIFEDTGFVFVLNGSFAAVDWEGFGKGGDETKLETFKRAIDRYKCEFRIVGNTVYLETQIGRDTQFMYRHRLNASNIVQEIDANEMWTYAKGYGDYEDSDEESGEGGWESAKLVREYTSPLASIVGIRHAPPIKDGRVKVTSAMDASLKTLVDESLKVSVSADIHDLRKQGYPLAQSELGDRVFLIDERIDLNDEVRVVSQSITRNWKGEVIDLNITFGSEGIAKRHQGNISTAIKNITELLEGKKKLPNTVFDSEIVNAAKAIKNARTELMFPDEGGIWGVDKDNPNYVTGMTSGGFMVSKDGGATPIAAVTGEGVVAETIIGRSIIGVNLTSMDESGYFHVNGSDAEFVNASNSRRVSISPDGLYGYNSNNSIRFQADNSLVTSAALGTSNYNVYLAAEDSGETLGEVRAVKTSTLGGGGDSTDYDYIDIRARSIKSAFGRHFYIATDSGELRVMSQGLLGSGTYRNIRANKMYANEYEVNEGDILYLRSNSRVRIMNEGSSSTYSDLQLAHIQAQSIRKNTEMGGVHFYLGAGDGELRVTSNGLADGVSRSVRAHSYLLPDGSEAFAGLSSSILAKPTLDEATFLVENTNVLRHTDNDKTSYKLIDTSMSVDEYVATLIKSNQEISSRLYALEEAI